MTDADAAKASYDVGLLYFEGKFVKKDEKSAKEHFQAAAKKDYAPAIEKLIEIYKKESSQKAEVLEDLLKIVKTLNPGEPMPSGKEASYRQLKAQAGLSVGYI